MRCFVSAGHGPRNGRSRLDPGAIAGGITEHELADWIARRIALGMKVLEPHVVPRTSLSRRIKYVNKWSRPGDVCVEIHMNSFTNIDAKGAEVYYCSGSKTGQQLGSLLLAGLARIGRPIRDVKPDSQSHVGSKLNRRGKPQGLGWCRRTKPWAALVEVAFITNPEERAWLIGGGAEQAAIALASSMDSWG
jgi:N-acetylmuramoyl-L-alanine amidase